MLAKRAFLTGEPGDAVLKVEATNYHSIPGRTGEIIRLPTRTLMAADEFYKAVNRRAAVNAMAYLREVNGILDAVKNRVPGLSIDLSARRNVWGDEIRKGNGAGGSALSSVYSFVSPVSSSRTTSSPLLLEVARLRAPLSMPQRKVRADGVDRKLTPEQYAYYVQMSGKPAKIHLEQIYPDARMERPDG